MEFYVYDKFRESLDDLLDIFNKHIVKISSTKWFLVDFIFFQYNCKMESLNPKNTVHKSVIDILTKYDIFGILEKLEKAKSKGLDSPLKGVKDKDKDQSKDMDKDKDKDKDSKKQHLDFVFLLDKEYEKIREWYGEETRDKYIEDLDGWILQIGKKKANAKYKSHYATILNWIRRDGIEKIKRTKEPEEKKPLKKRDQKTQELINKTVEKLKKVEDV